ncbi:sulfate/molybdate ABC transporter ATP-binding protein [Helicobacter turcicus]|uniref:Sulfate ABC transporter ATP-binding protein n=1 Tax=Helicobacter turcicus TaxID=2867412 RepID=A0ABS7JKR6_9HELI|nr:sulfate ABC transporter ATP-binding protein [Helicobacter turcicus]MBX7489989.1 sulfate ABC transporter ATP-binding protein [Helicobacter turcicus]MBX7544848.1 sulfate ABC transporter ATP-binding protein [Helicobacter turcicus]
MGIKIENIIKNFGSFVALDSINLDIKEGKLTALLGPSGSGKTTLLRIIAGLENADEGKISFFGKDITNAHAKDRGIGFVFQHYALFKHMNVFDNIAFGLRVRPKNVRPSKEEIKKKVNTLLSMIQLEFLANRMPHELSGGQKQRVALARALAIEPKVLLLDEPFGALDAKVRQDLRRWLRRLHDEISITSVFVTHDQEEALEVSDEIVIMQNGKIEQVGTPESVYENPANPFVYSFLGNVNLFSGRVGENGLVLGEGETLFVRPHEIEVFLQKEIDAIEARVIGHRILGARVRLDLMAQGREICAEIPKLQFDILRNSGKNSVFIRFLSLKSFQDNEWSEYVI